MWFGELSSLAVTWGWKGRGWIQTRWNKNAVTAPKNGMLHDIWKGYIPISPLWVENITNENCVNCPWSTKHSSSAAQCPVGCFLHDDQDWWISSLPLNNITMGSNHIALAQEKIQIQKVQFLLTVYHFRTIIKSRNPKVNHLNSGTICRSCFLAFFAELGVVSHAD